MFLEHSGESSLLHPFEKTVLGCRVREDGVHGTGWAGVGKGSWWIGGGEEGLWTRLRAAPLVSSKLWGVLSQEDQVPALQSLVEPFLCS